MSFFSINNALLLVIDIQGNLAYAMHDKTTLFPKIQGAIKAARIMGIPIVYTEQAPEKIGKTIPEISALLGGVKYFSKKSFSCCGAKGFLNYLQKSGKRQIIIVGIETHVCVFQTVADLLLENYQVQVVADAISSRHERDKDIALRRIQEMGGVLTSVEMLVTELLRTAEHPKFKEILNLIR